MGGGSGESGEAGKTGVSAVSERSESESESTGRQWVRDTGDTGKNGVSGASERPSSESERGALISAFEAAGEARSCRQSCGFELAEGDGVEVEEEAAA